jgi:hypothetical protein
MKVKDAILLAMVQGPIEFLRISSKKALRMMPLPLGPDRRHGISLPKERGTEIPRLVPGTIPLAVAGPKPEGD